MKTEEEFDELAKRQGGGFKAKQAMAADKLWDKPSVAFDEWWNGDNDESTNPYRLESGAYWAWAGWKAALAQPAQEPVAWLEPEWGEKICPEVGYEVTMTDDHPRDLCWIPLYAQRPWVDLTEYQIKTIEENALTKQWAIRMTIAQLKECNA